ncbi:hypothetical protein PInf_023144 [Phytophthora infestans]|nr:hypothetical protein PInf_023144 [Phytophthora infestans]
MAPNAVQDTRNEICTDTGSVTCQICLEELMSEDQTTINIVTHFCSKTCPAVFCTPCLEKLLLLAIEVPYTGALPKIRCPICLVSVNRQQWVRCLDPKAATAKSLIQRYTRLCEASCNFTYFANDVALTLRPCEKARIPELRRVVRRFCHHTKTTTARDVIRYVADNFAASKTNCIVHKILPRILDQERRATLLLTYHSIHRRVVTRCCGFFACFNCKRTMYDESTPCECEEEDKEMISDEDVIECRSCRVMIVKVDGCNSVWCVCGFSMSWTDEQRIKKLHQRKLLPVDPFDMTVYNHWSSWHYTFQSVVGESYWELRQSAILHSLNNSHPVFRETLRHLVWRRQFRRLITDAVLALRHRFMLRWYPAITESLRTLVWRRRRRRFHRMLLDEYRTTFVARTARHEAEKLKPVLLRLVWYCRFRNQVLGSLRRRFYCLSKGWGNLTEEQMELDEDQLAMLSIGLN